MTADWVGQVLGSTAYRVLRKLGVSGQMEFYLAEDMHHGAHVVIKAPTLDVLERVPSLAQRMALDYPALGRLSHPHILRLLDLGDHQGRPFFVRPFCTGGDLWRRMIGADGKLAPRPAENLDGWLPAVASALDYLHSQDLVHGDVHAANIFFDGDGHAFLGDPSLARPQANLEWAGPIFRTPHYLAPEVLDGGQVDARADQFSLALIVFEWLAGRSFVQGESLADVSRSHTNLRSLPNWIAGAWLPVFARALATKPEDRFPSCQDFSTTLLARIDASGNPVLDVEEQATFDLFCMDSVTGSDVRGLTALRQPAPAPTSTPAASATAGEEAKPSTQETAPAPSARPKLVPPPPRETPQASSSWITKAAALLLLCILAAAAGALFLPGTPLYEQMTAWLGMTPAAEKKDPADKKDGKPKGKDDAGSKSVKALKDLVEALELEVEDSTKQLRILRKDLKAETSRRASAEDRLATLTKENEMLRAQVKALEEKLKTRDGE